MQHTYKLLLGISPFYWKQNNRSLASTARENHCLCMVVNLLLASVLISDGKNKWKVRKNKDGYGPWRKELPDSTIGVLSAVLKTS